MKDTIPTGSLVLYKNNQLIAFNKPAGLPVQNDKTGDLSLLVLAQAYTKKKLELIHRIDRPASGVVLFAKSKSALAHLNAQFRSNYSDPSNSGVNPVEKTYLAIVKNRPAEDCGTLVHYLRKNQEQNRSVAYDKEVAHSKKAELSYRLLGSSDHYYLLQIELHSGRHHQIRAQLGAIGCPIKGDVKYGFKRANADRSIHLHAWKMSFQHPIAETREHIVAPMPEGPLWDFFGECVS